MANVTCPICGVAIDPKAKAPHYCSAGPATSLETSQRPHAPFAPPVVGAGPPSTPAAPAVPVILTEPTSSGNATKIITIVVASLLVLFVAVFAGLFLLRGGDDSVAEAPEPTEPAVTPVTLAPTVESEPTEESAPQTTIAPTDTEATPSTTSAAPVTNPFGDVVGQPPTSGHVAARFAQALASGTLDSTVTPDHTDAYYYSMWSRNVARFDPAAGVTTTATGYALQLADGRMAEIRGFVLDAAGLVVDLEEAISDAVVSIDGAVTSSGICQPPPGTCDQGLLNGGHAKDAGGTEYRLYLLARVGVDPDFDTLIMFLNGPLGAPQQVPATASPSIDDVAVRTDPTLSFLLVTFSKNPPQGTTLRLDVTTQLGQPTSFEFVL